MYKITFIAFFVSLSIFSQSEKYRLIINDDPATSGTIAWHQPISSIGSSILYYGTEDFGSDWNSYPNSQEADRTSLAQQMHTKFVRLTNLQPNTAYYFVLRNPITNVTSERMFFKTLPNDQSRLSFVAGGDSRTDGTPDVFANRDARLNANRMVAKVKPHGIFFGGDFTFADTPTEWDYWLDDWQLTISDEGQLFGIVPARGNHEFNPSTVYDLFDVPISDSYYAITFGNNLVRAYTLNSEISVAGDQALWLENDLQENNADQCWTFAQYHTPIRPHESGKTENDDQYDAWAGLFYEYGVDLVFESDSHMVKTTKALKPDVNGELGFSEDPLNGTYYVGEGCWGAPTRNNDDDKEWTLASGSFNQIKWVWVDCERIEMRTIMTDNAEEVASLGDNIFEEPDNIELWNPESIGEVLVIQNQALSNPDFVKTNVAVYPNPFKGILNVEVPSILEKVNITLYDINGRLLLNETKKVVRGSFTINTTTISNGMVFLRISTTRGQAIATKKLLKE
ncbi:MAG: hypothetical protein CL817_04200 [Croceibacter sp.]|nr:hypothetical protein [Croceibacter sp.]